MSGEWGYVDVSRHRVLQHGGVELRVFVDGEDVTRRCVEFTDHPERRSATLLKHDAEGHPYVEGGKAATEQVTEFEVRVMPLAFEVKGPEMTEGAN